MKNVREKFQAENQPQKQVQKRLREYIKCSGKQSAY